ncbi:MAG: hypothetical protein IJ730_02800 [Alphaproteobacteria bacterium]|nr:hypothetical protein [Alphaproteobacteria bacterium]
MLIKKGISLNPKEGLSALLKRNLENYLASHSDGKVPPGLYNRILNEVEKVIFPVTLKYVKGNQTQAAEILGISRNTLRKKIQMLYGDNFDK